MIRLIYVAGPLRGPDNWAVETNIRAAEAVARSVAEMGGMPVVPHTMTRFWGCVASEDFWLQGTLRLLEVCDAMVLVPGWETSAGTRSEVAAFQEWGRGDRIFETIDQLRGYLA